MIHFHVTRGTDADFETPHRALRSIALTPRLEEVETHRDQRGTHFELRPVGLLSFRRRAPWKQFRIAGADGHRLPVVELRW